ncbi:hypothetical protein ABT58_02655 [Photobacterium aphoticum]|uniref:Uncharacterized protein n=1 Tax=Photobacterium aphoticum TaxID=754436 RepID=A0A0J1JKD9_9GAMM|nr:hypothetical protein ABT58_02655 [Photobacterium aphoticum]
MPVFEKDEKQGRRASLRGTRKGRSEEERKGSGGFASDKEKRNLWTYGPMDLWTYGPMDLWTYGPMESIKGRIIVSQYKMKKTLQKNKHFRFCSSIGPQGQGPLLLFRFYSKRSETRP